MVGRLFGGMPGSLALVARNAGWWPRSWRFAPPLAAHPPASRPEVDEQARRFDRFRYHLGRGRRAREAGRFERGSIEARRALALNPADPWALALLGQCLRQQRPSDLSGARSAFKRAWSLDPTNGYFVGLLLGVLRAQGDTAAARDVLEWSWWRGAPVERWLPGGPPIPAREQRGAVDPTPDRGAASAPPVTPSARRMPGSGSMFAGHRPVPA